ncbi:hypothetical protein ACP70R_005225 [Stipagrostis hirtigluma subsp. patula]
MAFCKACRPTNAPESAADRFCPLRFRSCPPPRKEGLVIKNHKLAKLIELAANFMWVFTIGFYIVASIDILRSFELLKALGIIASITPFFILAWRSIPFFKIAYTEDYAMAPPDSDLPGKVPVENPRS